MNNKIKIIACIMIFLVGLSVMLYPSISNFMHQRAQVGVIDDYREKAEKMSKGQLDELKDEARKYNARLAAAINGSDQSAAAPAADNGYFKLLNINDDVMAYISIPLCDINLPIRHGCDEEVLQQSAGHLPGSSLPIGGESTHAVITAHRGLPSAKLFTNLDALKLGDQFYIHVLDEILAYEVDQIKVVLPDDTRDLRIIEGEDYVTLVTCTPYGINTHRLLVRGKRTEYIPELEEAQTAEGKRKQVKTFIFYLLGFVAAVLVIVLIYIIKKKLDKNKKIGENNKVN